MSELDEIRIAHLLRTLPPAPEAWVRAAQELPFVRQALDKIIARAEADAAFRTALVADLEAALTAAGFDPHPLLVVALRERLPHR